MAMKLSNELKQIDSYARNLNSQLEKAYKNLGADSKIYKNLLAHSKIYFGTSNLRYNKNGIAQISRGKKALESYNKTDAIKKSQKEYYHRQTPVKGAKPISKKFDVSNAYQQAINQIKQQKKQGRYTGDITKSSIQKQLELNDKHNEIFAMYETWRDNNTFGADEHAYRFWDRALKILRDNPNLSQNRLDAIYEIANKYKLKDNRITEKEMKEKLKNGVDITDDFYENNL